MSRTYQRTEEVIAALRDFNWSHETNEADRIISRYMVEYFAHLDNPREEEFPEVYDVWPYLPTLTLRAIRLFEESQLDWVVNNRRLFMKATGGDEVCSGILTESSSVAAPLLRQQFRRVMEKSMPERTPDYSILEGSYLALDIYFNKFIEEVYIGQGMHERIMSAEKRGIGGVFGETKLLTYDIAGRIMFTFSRGAKSFSYVKESEDKLALGAGLQSCNVDLILALTMIEDVIKNYDPEKFLEDDEICMV